jgi:hypothetical protein
MSVAICVKCGKGIEMKEFAGSYKHPFHKKCFKERFNSYEEYFSYLAHKHMPGWD